MYQVVSAGELTLTSILCWILGTSVQKTRHVHQPDFPFLSLSSGERHGTALGMENGSLVFFEKVGRCIVNQASTPRVCLVHNASTSAVKRKTQDKSCLIPFPCRTHPRVNMLFSS